MLPSCILLNPATKAELQAACVQADAAFQAGMLQAQAAKFAGELTFAGGGFALAAAIVTVFLTYLGESYRHHQDRQVTAGSLSAEITPILVFLTENKISWNCSQLLQLLFQLEKTQEPWTHPGKTAADELPLETPVYDKISDRVGILGPEVGQSVVDFYSRLNVIRKTYKIAYGTDTPRIEGRIRALDFLVRALPDQITRGQHLIELLEDKFKARWGMGILIAVIAIALIGTGLGISYVMWVD